MKALLIEDNRVLATITGRSLKALRFSHVDIAHSGKEALEFLSRQTYHVILVDWMLPYGSGLDVVHCIRASKQHKDTPVIMTTGKREREDIIKALESGVNSYLVKPIRHKVLKERIDQILDAS
jgi:DNA-binding response OmpR family regulator